MKKNQIYKAMDAKNFRIKNLRKLSEKYGGDSKLAEMLDRDKSQISQLIGKNPKVNFGERIARKIEQKLSLPTGWLDQDHSKPTLELKKMSEIIHQPSLPVAILELPSAPGSPWVITREKTKMENQEKLNWLGLDHTKTLSCIAQDDSMANHINKGDSLLIDERINSIDQLIRGKAYAVKLGNEFLICRIHVEPQGRIRLTFDSNDKNQYPDISMSKDEANSCMQIIGKIAYIGKKD